MAVTKKKTTKKKTTGGTKKPSTEVTKKGDSPLAALGDGLLDVAIAEGGESWGAGSDLSDNSDLYQNDFLIPKIWQVQAMSEILKDKNSKARQGDFINSLTGDILSNSEEGLRFVVVSTFKKWQAFSLDDSNNKVFESDYGGIMTLENANWPYKEELDGKSISRRQVNSFIVLLEEDVKQRNPQPYCIDFAASSKKAGRILVTAVKNSTDKWYEGPNGPMKLPAAAFAYEVKGHIEKFEKGECYVKDIKGVGHSNKSAVEMAREMYDFVKQNEQAIRFDERDIVDEDGTVNTTSAKVSPNETADGIV